MSTSVAVLPVETDLPRWRLHLLRVGYLILGAGLVAYKWPLLFHHATPWPTMDSIVICMLVAMSLLAFLGLRHPVALIPILLFEVTWKLLWLAVVATPEWLHHTMDTTTRQSTTEILWVVAILPVIPYRYAWSRYVTHRADPWR